MPVVDSPQKVIDIFFSFLTEEEIKKLDRNERTSFKDRVFAMCKNLRPQHSVILTTEMSRTWIDSMRIATREEGIGSIKEEILTFFKLRLFEI